MINPVSFTSPHIRPVIAKGTTQRESASDRVSHWLQAIEAQRENQQSQTAGQNLPGEPQERTFQFADNYVFALNQLQQTPSPRAPQSDYRQIGPQQGQLLDMHA